MKKILMLLTALLLMGGCSLQRVVTKKGYDFAQIKRIAITPFSGTSQFRNSGDVVADEFVFQLMNKGYTVVERNKIDAIMRERGMIKNGETDYSNLKELGKLLGVDAIITGSVVKYQEDSQDTYYSVDKDGRSIASVSMNQAVVEISARMIDIATGEIVWTSKNKDYAFDVSDAVSSSVYGLVESIK